MRIGRTGRTLLAALAAVLAAGLLRPQGAVGGLPLDLFWYQKMLWRQQFDLVIAGDSRAVVDISPEAMQAAPEIAALEAARSKFDASAFARDFEAAGGKWLRPAGGPFQFYDGHHLLPSEARRLSAELAAAIAR